MNQKTNNMSNSVNNLKNCVFCLFILCFLSSCIVEERHEINEDTGLEWTFKKYRNGDESITVGNQTIRGKDVDYFFSGENLFRIISDSAYIYYASESMLLQITAIPKHGQLHTIITVSRERRDEGNRLFCSSNGDFWIQNQYEDNDGYWYADLYNRNGNYIATVSKCFGIKCKNPYWDYVDYYKVQNEFGERKVNRPTKVGVYDVNGNLVVPIVYYDVGEIYWSFGEEVANLYTFIAQKGTLDGEGFFHEIQSYDVISYSGELLLSLDLSKRSYFANGKQNVLDNWRIEYDSDSGISWYEEDSMWAALERRTFKGYNVYPLDIEDYDDSYFITKIDNAFYLLHRYKNRIIESARIPLASKTISSSSTESGKKQTVTSVPVQRFKACPSCLGGGLCSYCNGSGIYYHPGGSAPCAVCGGFGRCSMCAGRGGEYITEY